MTTAAITETRLPVVTWLRVETAGRRKGDTLRVSALRASRTWFHQERQSRGRDQLMVMATEMA